MVAAACIINDGSSDDRFTDFRNWLIMQGYDAYRQALIDPDNLAALNIPFRDTEWMGCGNVAWYAYTGQKLHTYFEKEGIAAKLFRKYPALLKSSADLHQAIMQEQLVPHRAPETEWERQMLRTEVKHYIDTSGLAYSYNEFYTQNMPDKVAWKTLQSDLFSNLPQIKAECMPQDFSVVLPKLWRKRQAWDWESLVGLCDEFLYLGGTEKETHKYVSELLGKETISTTSYNQSKGRSGSYSINHQQSGRDMPYLFVKSSVALNLS